MTLKSLCSISFLSLCNSMQAWAATDANPPGPQFQEHWAGYLTSSAFSEDVQRLGVIRTPANLRAGDLLWIRPFRLNSDEYLILQKCLDPACKKAEVVRAWNAYGYMGPDPVLNDKVPVQPGATYLLWMQRVPSLGNGSFKLYQRDTPPLVFEPAGSQELTKVADLRSAQKHGPARIQKAESEQASFVVTFEGGSVVRMQALRVDTNLASAVP